MQQLFHTDELAEGQVRGFDPAGVGQDALFVLRHEGQLHAWANACPHLNVPMAWRRDAYLNASGSHVQCHAHGALFDKASGLCVQGPCLGQHLRRIALVTDDRGQVHALAAQDKTDQRTTSQPDRGGDMTAVNKILIVGGGFSGMAAAIQLRKTGLAVDLIEIDPDWRPLGAGITIGGPTLRALQTLGVYEAVVEHGYVSNGVEICLPNGHKVADLPTPAPIGSTVAGGGAIMRPVLARILADATRAAGVDVRLGCGWSDIRQDAEGVDVSFTDGSQRRYDLVIGADGVHSALRAKFFPEVKEPDYIGQGVWRAVMPRPDSIVRPRMWLGHHIKLGVNPVSATHMYMFITEDRPTKERIDPATWPEVFANLMKGFPDPLVASLIPHALTPEAAIDYRPLANLLVPAPWNRGRVVLIGDTVAATTPHLASGAGIGIESGIVLAEELAAAGDLQTALDRFHARRWERCRMVIQNSERLCRIEIEGGDKDEHGRIMRESIVALIQPI